MVPHRSRDDEDKGSPSRGGANCYGVLIQAEALINRQTKKSTVQRKPFGCAITRNIFPSEIKILPQHRVSNPADKEAGNGIIQASGIKC